MGDAAVSEGSTPDGSNSSNADGSTTDTETSADTNGDDDHTTSSGTDTTDTGDTDPEETSDDGSDIDAGSNTGTTSDDGSVACSEGRYAADNGECQAWTECEPGAYVASPGTADSDQECQPCESGTYSDAANVAECLPWDNCGWFETSQAGTNTSNVECLQADNFDQFGTTGNDAITSIGANATGSVVVAGSAGGPLYSGAEGSGFVRLYDPMREVEWTRQFGEEFLEQINDVSLNPSGDMFIAGTLDGLAEGGDADSHDAFVVRVSPSDGSEIWRRRFGTTLRDEAAGIASDASGNSVVVGWTLGSLSGTNHGESDAVVRQYGSSGEVHWTRQFGTDTSDYASAVAIGPDGEIAVVGSTDGDLAGETAGSSDGFLRVYTADGTSHRTVQFGTDIFDQTEAVAFLPTGEIAVTGYSWDSPANGSVFLRLYRPEENAALELVWARTVIVSTAPGRGVAVSAGVSGNIVVAATLWDSTVDALVQRYDARGDLLGERQLSTDGGAYAVALVGEEEHVLVGGSTSGTLSGTNAGNGDAFVGIVTLLPHASP